MTTEQKAEAHPYEAFIRGNTLDLRHKDLTGGVVRTKLIPFLEQHREITFLNARSNQIGDDGATALAGNATLESLDVANNNIGAELMKNLYGLRVRNRVFQRDYDQHLQAQLEQHLPPPGLSDIVQGYAAGEYPHISAAAEVKEAKEATSSSSRPYGHPSGNIESKRVPTRQVTTPTVSNSLTFFGGNGDDPTQPLLAAQRNSSNQQEGIDAPCCGPCVIL
jgi:hypothetical protein